MPEAGVRPMFLQEGVLDQDQKQRPCGLLSVQHDAGKEDRFEQVVQIFM
jgi:hypothetical protein